MVSADEFVQFYTHVTQEDSADDFLAGMEKYDEDRNKRNAIRIAEMTKIFHEIDQDGDQVLSIEECKQFGIAIHAGTSKIWTERDARNWRKKMDHNGDGDVKLEEFLAFYEPIFHKTDAEFTQGLRDFHLAIARIKNGENLDYPKKKVNLLRAKSTLN